MPDTLVIPIPDYWPPSLNQVMHANWTKVRKARIKAKEYVGVYALRANGGGMPVFKGPVQVKIERLYGGGRKEMDIDNLWGSVKPVVDALRKVERYANGRKSRGGGHGIIDDDDPGNLDLVVRQEKKSPAVIHELSAPNLPLGLPITIACIITITGDKVQ